MKKSILLYFVLLVSLFVVGCSEIDTTNLEKESDLQENYPFKVYSYTDSDGCKYLVPYENGAGGGIGVGITPKVNQPLTCLEKKKE